MKGLEKTVPIRLEREQYDHLRLAILQRDGWRCQFCGAMSNLEVHHQQFRSHSGEDTEENLITLCDACHSRIHHQATYENNPKSRSVRRVSIVTRKISGTSSAALQQPG